MQCDQPFPTGVPPPTSTRRASPAGAPGAMSWADRTGTGRPAALSTRRLAASGKRSCLGQQSVRDTPEDLRHGEATNGTRQGGTRGPRRLGRRGRGREDAGGGADLFITKAAPGTEAQGAGKMGERRTLSKWLQRAVRSGLGQRGQLS